MVLSGAQPDCLILVVSIKSNQKILVLLSCAALNLSCYINTIISKTELGKL